MKEANQQIGLYEAAERFVLWLEKKILSSATGENDVQLDVEPSGKYWLGRLSTEEYVSALGLEERGERLSPCAMGIRLRPKNTGVLEFKVTVRFCVWLRDENRLWQKTSKSKVTISVSYKLGSSELFVGGPELSASLNEISGVEGFSAEIRVETGNLPKGEQEISVSLVNTASEDQPHIRDKTLYECSLSVHGLKTQPYLLESLPDSFRYNREVGSYGINCGVVLSEDGSFTTSDTIGVNRYRPSFWNSSEEQPDLTFTTLADDCLQSVDRLEVALSSFENESWSEQALSERAEDLGWTPEMLQEAEVGAGEFQEELSRIRTGIALLRSNEQLLRSFRLMNRAMQLSANGKYDSWRPFQIGFLLANLNCIHDPHSESEVADIVWFATGGGKTETYLGLLITAAIYDRLTGKLAGITAWSRFPLRMLSLQQTQRFANAMAGAEIVRREEGIPGEPFSVGFFVGQGATPNRIPATPKPGLPDCDDEAMPASYQVLLKCPFCHLESIEMAFDRRQWKLQHCCTNSECQWSEKGLPFYVVDEEVYRFLPTVVVGTLDKAASISMQGAMRGFVASPFGKCSIDGHGYTYGVRSTKPNGCLVPGCRGSVESLDIPEERFAPSFRLQDELHLLKDSLGAVDAHYESILDDLQKRICGFKPKILASSATLTGYQKQVDVLYQRSARVFPIQGPSIDKGFWTSDSNQLMRRFVGLAPRGVTLEYAIDKSLTELQNCIRTFHKNPESICQELGVPLDYAKDLVSLYGTDVVYGNTLRDLDAVIRSAQTQLRVAGQVNSVSLTGKTDFDEVRNILAGLEEPDEDFYNRVHVIAASSMMSHGVDIDRLNVMCVLGLPLTTAEFLQSTARVGRRWPGLVFVAHKIGRERDSSVYRSFEKFIEQGDRFVEAIPITRRSRRVLERTITGLELARILILHEPLSGTALTTVARLRNYCASGNFSESLEFDSLVEALNLSTPLDESSRKDLAFWFERFFRNLQDPGGDAKFPSDLSPSGQPMRSLRDVDEQVPIYGSRIK